MEALLQEIEGSAVLRTLLEGWAPTCWLCEWVLDDLRSLGRLSGRPIDFNGQPVFPIDGKLRHVLLELGEPVPDWAVEPRDLIPEILAVLRVMS